MLKSKMKKIISMGLLVVAFVVVNPICANAEWINNDDYDTGINSWNRSTGSCEGNSYITSWWYKEGDSYAIGWRMIDGKWYYFDSKGYMRVGWTEIDGKWYYLDNDGHMLSNTVKDGYTLAADGHWDTSSDAGVTEQINSFTYEKALELSKNMGITGFDTIVEVNPEQKFDHLENKPYYFVKFIEKGTNKVISSCELFEDGNCVY